MVKGIKKGHKIFFILLLGALILGLYYVNTTRQKNIMRDAQNEAEMIRNRAFPMAGQEVYGNDAGMETGDDSVPLLNRGPAVDESSR